MNPYTGVSFGIQAQLLIFPTCTLTFSSRFLKGYKRRGPVSAPVSFASCALTASSSNVSMPQSE